MIPFEEVLKVGKELQAYVESYPQKCPMANRRGWVSCGRKKDILGGRGKTQFSSGLSSPSWNEGPR